MLQGRSDSLMGAVRDAEDPLATVMVDPAELKVPSSDAYAIYTIDGQLIASSNNAPATLIARRRVGFSNQLFQGKAYRLVERDLLRVIDRAETQGIGLMRPVTLIYAAPTGHIWEEIIEAAAFYALLSLALLGLTASFLSFSLRQVLRPIEELAAEAAAVSKDALYFTPPPSALGVRELVPLTTALSDTISSLRNAFEYEQRFVGDAAHELKTAVAVVRSTIQLLAMKLRSSEEYREGLQSLLQDNQRVEDLISRMLILARMDQSTTPETTGVDLGGAVRSAVHNLAPIAAAHSANVVLRCETGLWVRLSSEKAEVLVANLVVNAVQHSVAGSEIEVTVSRVGDHAHLRVRDTGSGISALALPHIFKRFYREDSSRSRETGGAGLGLAISQSFNLLVAQFSW
jgi:signal transduction histidine kinase